MCSPMMSIALGQVKRIGKGTKALSEDLFDQDQAQWEGVYRANVIGTFFVSPALLLLLHAPTKSRHHTTGSIITPTTMSHVIYHVSNAHLTTILAQMSRSKTIRVGVNSIAPDIFPSEMTGEFS